MTKFYHFCAEFLNKLSIYINRIKSLVPAIMIILSNTCLNSNNNYHWCSYCKISIVCHTFKSKYFSIYSYNCYDSSFSGEVTDLQLFSRALRHEEIQGMTDCTAEYGGDIINWDTATWEFGSDYTEVFASVKSDRKQCAFYKMNFDSENNSCTY